MLRKRSFGSVEITSIDEPALREALRRGVQACVAAHPEVVKIVLFGSFARGDWAPDSDVDVLIVVTHSDRPRLERAEALRTFFEPIPLDVNPLVLTTDEAERSGRDPANVAHAALAEGIVLFERETAPIE